MINLSRNCLLWTYVKVDLRIEDQKNSVKKMYPGSSTCMINHLRL